MPVDHSVIAEIQAKVDLLQYAGQYVTLRKRGREYNGLCPFHAEKTPSFWLNAEKGVFHCYGCGAGGDLFKFVQRYDNVDFPTALRMLAQRAGVTLEESRAAGRQRSEREAIFEANAAAQSHFAAQLRRDERAQAYLRSRGLDEQTAAAFGIGYAPDAWESLVQALGRAGIEPRTAALAGLVRARPQAGYYDFFRDRIMLPVYNLTGEVIAFGGRALGDEQPKYLNTPNTPAYVKGRHMYALNVARRVAATDGALVVVEGYFDAIGLHQAGITNAVASLGTAFTPEQARELRRVANNLYLCFDGDRAGQAATARSIDMLVDEGLAVRVVALPAGVDPDDFVRERGAAAFAALLDASERWRDFKIAAAIRQLENRFTDPADAAREAVAVIATVTDPIERDLYIKAMSERFGVSERALRTSRPAAPPPRVGAPADRSARRSAPAAHAKGLERELLQILLARPSLIERAAREVTPTDLEDGDVAHAFARLAENAEALSHGVHPLTLFEGEEIVDELGRLAVASPSLSLDDDEQRLGRILERIELRRMKRRHSKLDAEINEFLRAGHHVPHALREEYNALAASLRGIAGDFRASRDARAERG